MKEKIKELGKRLLTIVVAIAMVLTGIPTMAFAAENDVGSGMGVDTNTGSTEIESNKEYLIPVDICDATGESIEETGMTKTIADFVDNAALVKKNNDGTYHVTLQLENYDKIDVFQISKPGAIDDSIKPNKGSMGTFNIPDTYIFSDKVDGVENATTYMKGKKVPKQQNTYIDESWNDYFIQDATVEVGTSGRTYYSLKLPTPIWCVEP